MSDKYCVRGVPVGVSVAVAVPVGVSVADPVGVSFALSVGGDWPGDVAASAKAPGSWDDASTPKKDRRVKAAAITPAIAAAKKT